MEIANLRCEYETNPLGLDVQSPRFSWQLFSEQRGDRQTAYRILVSDSEAVLAENRATHWDSKRVTSDRSIQIEYLGEPLDPQTRYFWKVLIWDAADKRHGWSEPAFWETGLLTPDGWQAAWIAPSPFSETVPDTAGPAPYFRREFQVTAGVATARLYATALGTYELELDGHRVGDAYFRPGWTSYKKILQYQTYDVTAAMTPGKHALGAIVGDGWFRGTLFVGDGGVLRNRWGDTPALLLQLVIRYEDGREQLVVTSDRWQVTNGPILKSDHYWGEHYDARKELSGWSTVGYDDSHWDEAALHNHPKSILVSQVGPSVEKMASLTPTLLHSPAGQPILDFGQNMVGWVRFEVEAPAGTTITLRHGERLDPQGELYTENLRAAEQKIIYTCNGNGREAYEPRFTFMGFRYVAVAGWPGQLNPNDFTGVVLYSGLEPAGQFSCSDARINQLQQNIIWGQRGNFLEIPTDCPQRDERLGWTGDIQVFGPTACYNMDVRGFLTKWLRSLAADQRPDGAYPFFSPQVPGYDGYAAAGWADAGLIVPWTLYHHYGDKRVLEEQYPYMQRWVAYMYERAGESLIWRDDFQFGDWLSTDRPEMGSSFGMTDEDLIATAFYAYSAHLLSEVANVLDRPDDAAAYASIARAVKDAFASEFLSENGRLSGNTQTAYVLALAFDLLPPDKRTDAASRLVGDIRQRGNKLATGFLGTPHLCHVLTDFGYQDIAYELLFQDEFPSWLFPLQHGATTIWERWDGVKTDGTFQDPGMNSFNHYAYGAIGHWLYATVAGLRHDPKRPGYKRAIIQPVLGAQLTHAAVSLQTGYGEYASSWRISDEAYELSVTIPTNGEARIHFPVQSHKQIVESGRPVADAPGISGMKHQRSSNEVIIEARGGQYHFTVRFSDE